MMKRYAFILSLIACQPAAAQYFSAPPAVMTNGTVTSAPAMMLDYNRLISDGNTAFNDLEAAVAGVSGEATPAHAVVPFNLAACPTGWSAANGAGGTVNMAGYFARVTTSGAGTVQTSQFLDHTHTITGTFVNSATGTSNFFNSGGIARITGSSTLTVDAVSGAVAGTETRPKNVALLYCEKN